MFVTKRCDDFDFMSAEYHDLYDRSTGTLFQHPVWLHHIYTSLAPTMEAEPLVLTVRDCPAGRLLVVLPLVRRRGGLVRRVEFADLGVSDYAAPVVDRTAYESILGDPSVSGAIRAAIGPVDLLRIDKIPATPAPFASLLGTNDAVRHNYDTHTIPLGSSFEAWRQQSLDPTFTRHLDRKRKRLRPKGKLGFRQLADPHEIDDALVRMQEFRRVRFADRRAIDLVQDPDCFAFYRAVALDSARLGGPGHTTALTIDGETVAASFGLSDSERHLFLLIGFDFEKYRNYSLGLIIVEELIAASIGQGQHEFDLTVGNEGYKSDFGAQPTSMHSVRAPATLRGGLARVAADQNLVARKFAKRAIAYHDEHLKGRNLKGTLRLPTRAPPP